MYKAMKEVVTAGQGKTASGASMDKKPRFEDAKPRDCLPAGERFPLRNQSCFVCIAGLLSLWSCNHS